MPRSLPEWIGKTDDSIPPPRVQLRVFQKQGERCAGCGRRLVGAEPKTCDHKKALINGGPNRESNLQILGDLCCTPAKDRADVAEKSRVAQKAKKNHGFERKPSRPMPGAKNSRFKKTFGFGWVDRETGEPLRGRRT